MNLTAKLDNLVFHVLLGACLVAVTVFGSRYALSLDLTRDARNSLNAHSLSVISAVDTPTEIAVYAGRGSSLVQAGRDLSERYTRENPLIQFTHIDIDRDPSLARSVDIRGQGAVVVQMGDARQHSQSLSERAVTGALEALVLGQARRALFVSGHGERSATGAANHHYGEFSHRLQQRGYTIADTNLQIDSLTPIAGDLLVIASPQRAFETAELATLSAYINDGGHVLWLTDGDLLNADTIAQLTGLTRLPGVIVDAASESLGLPRPDFAVVNEYSSHPITDGMDGIALFPRAVAFAADSLQEGWQATPWLSSTARSWNESGDIAGHIAPDASGEMAGPLAFAWTLTHAHTRGSVSVIGDGDFLANSWLGNGVNLALGERIFDTLSRATSAAPPPRAAAVDRTVTLSRAQGLALGTALFGLLPLALAMATFCCWRRQAH